MGDGDYYNTVFIFIWSNYQSATSLGKPSSRGGLKFVFSLINGLKKDIIKKWLICFFKHSQ